MTDFVQDLEAELLAAARRRATGRRRPLPRIAWRPLAIAAAAVAVLAVAVLALRPSEPQRPATPGAFLPVPVTPIAACDGTAPPDLPTTFRAIGGAPPSEVTRALAVLRSPYARSEQLLAIAAPLDTWLPVGEHDPKAVRRASVPASYLVPTSDLRTKPLACGGGKSRGPGVCLVMPGRFACFTLAEIRAGRAVARNGRHYVGIAPDGPTWVRLNASLAALAVHNVFEQVANSEPLDVTFAYDAPSVAVLNATHTPTLAANLADTLTSVFGTRASAGYAPIRSATTTVFFRRRQDKLLASAIACYLGASATGEIGAATTPNIPDNVDFVVVIGERM